MSMRITWVRVSTDLPDHPKSHLLAAELNEHNAWAYMARLIMWCSNYAQDGRLPARMSAVIERACGWQLGADDLLSAMHKVGFLERTPDGIFAVHDWEEHQGAAIRQANHDSDRKRKWREQKKKVRAARRRDGDVTVPRTIDGQHPGTSKVPDLTGPDGTLKEEEKKTSPSAPQVAKARSPSSQERFALWFAGERKEALGDDWSEDNNLSVKRLNKELTWLATAGEEVEEAVQIYLSDPYRRKQDPPCSLLWFAKDRAEYVSKAKRGAA